MSQQTNVKILNVYHKPYKILKNDVIIPINAGRNIALSKSKDGFISKDDLDWLKNNTISDGDGDNISDLNRYFNEMTAIYWAWKNYHKLDNPDYIGLMHYRRHFIFHFNKTGNTYEDVLGSNAQTITNFMKEYDFICKPFNKIKGKTTLQAIYDGYYGYKLEQPINKSLEYIKNHYPNDYDEIHNILQEKVTGGLCNMFVMKKEIFFEYCNWIFPILFHIYENTDKDTLPSDEERFIGFTSELLTSLYLKMISKRYNFKEVCVFENYKTKTMSIVEYIYKNTLAFFASNYTNLKNKILQQKIYKNLTKKSLM